MACVYPAGPVTLINAFRPLGSPATVTASEPVAIAYVTVAVAAVAPALTVSSCVGVVAAHVPPLALTDAAATVYSRASA